MNQSANTRAVSRAINASREPRPELLIKETATLAIEAAYLAGFGWCHVRPLGAR